MDITLHKPEDAVTINIHDVTNKRMEALNERFKTSEFRVYDNFEILTIQIENVEIKFFHTTEVVL